MKSALNTHSFAASQNASARGVEVRVSPQSPHQGVVLFALRVADGPSPGGEQRPTTTGWGLPAAEMGTLPTRSRSRKNVSYKGLTAQSFTDLDWLAFVEATS